MTRRSRAYRAAPSHLPWFVLTLHRTPTYGSRTPTVRQECGQYPSFRRAENQAYLRVERRMRASRGRVLWSVEAARSLRGAVDGPHVPLVATRPVNRSARCPITGVKIFRGVISRHSVLDRAARTPLRTHRRTIIAMSRQQASRILDAIVEEHNAEGASTQRWKRHGLAEVAADLERTPLRVIRGRSPIVRATSRPRRTR